MIFFSVVLTLLGLSTLLWRDDDLIGLPPVVAGSGLLVLGVAAGALWVVRRRRRWERAGEPRPVGNVVERAKALPRLLRERKAYGLPTSTLATWGFAVVYLVSPIDVLPELLPIIGVTDDAGVAVWLLTSVSTVAGQYLRWERERRDPKQQGPKRP
ncbi:YkvA family protein [Saccharothrix deserti]|uniref:YkvA family protein n=1 Tax=Saccharothrix deserti TaxID=2593674 RepID=UPI00131CC303|nr:YkvA family protein [Saccharothrix deserti]